MRCCALTGWRQRRGKAGKRGGRCAAYHARALLLAQLKLPLTTSTAALVSASSCRPTSPELCYLVNKRRPEDLASEVKSVRAQRIKVCRPMASRDAQNRLLLSVDPSSAHCKLRITCATPAARCQAAVSNRRQICRRRQDAGATANQFHVPRRSALTPWRCQAPHTAVDCSRRSGAGAVLEVPIARLPLVIDFVWEEVQSWTEPLRDSACRPGYIRSPRRSGRQGACLRPNTGTERPSTPYLAPPSVSTRLAFASHDTWPPSACSTSRVCSSLSHAR